MTFPRLPRTAAAPLSVLTASALTLGALSTAAIAAAAPGVPPSLVATDPTIAQPASDPLYTPPAEIPGTPGTLIRSQQASHPLDVAARADKILFTSTTQDGVPSPPRERSSNRRAPGPVPGQPHHRLLARHPRVRGRLHPPARGQPPRLHLREHRGP